MNRPFIPRIKNADATYDSFPDWQASEGEGLGGAPGADEIYKVTAAVIPDGLHLQWMCNCGRQQSVVYEWPEMVCLAYGVRPDQAQATNVAWAGNSQASWKPKSPCNCGGPIDVVINSADVQSAVTGGMNAGYVQQDQNAVRLMQHFKGIAAQQGRR